MAELVGSDLEESERIMSPLHHAVSIDVFLDGALEQAISRPESSPSLFASLSRLWTLVQQASSPKDAKTSRSARSGQASCRPLPLQTQPASRYWRRTRPLRRPSGRLDSL